MRQFGDINEIRVATVAQLADVEGMNERAAELGMTERAVEGRLYRLKKRLRTMLGGDGDA